MTAKELINYAQLMESAADYMAEKKGEPFQTPESVAAFMYPLTRDLEQEHIWVITIDSKGYLKSLCDVTVGTVNSCLAHPREIFKQAVLDSAASVIVIHNHPSGDPTPSKQDVALTKQLIEAGKILEIRLHDHVIVGKKADISSWWYSTRRELILDFE